MKTTNHKLGCQLLLILLVLGASACSILKNTTMKKNKVEDSSTGENKFILTAPIVSKSLFKKNGVPTGGKEWYLQRSIQDYYIKFCESNIQREELEQHLAKQTGLIQTLTLEVELREGHWDICDDNFMQQSRIGEYMIIHRIIDNQ
jgi:hypothetical protein